MVTKTEVEQAYRWILGREPESPAAVASLAESASSIEQLRQMFFNSQEFTQRYQPMTGAVRPQPMDRQAIHVEVDVEPSELQEMMRHVEASWENLGNTELFWSVLTHEQYLSSNLQANLDAFYASGEWTANLLQRAAERAGIALSKDMTCLELGCGAGRITIWLAQQFQHVIACDISQPHLEAAREAAELRGITNLELIRTNSMDRLSGLPNFDVFFSVIVLQHNPPPVALAMLRTLLRKLNPGGVAYFQVPTYAVNYSFNAGTYLDWIAEHHEMEMHAIPQRALFALFAAENCEILEVREDDWAGSPDTLSNTFFIRKAD